MDQGPAVSSDDSCDSETKNMRSQLNEFGLDEENLSKEEMSDLLRALRNSKTSEREDELSRQKMNIRQHIKCNSCTTKAASITNSVRAVSRSNCYAWYAGLYNKVEEKTDSVNVNTPSPKKTMKRKYLNVRDRRMPWSILPNTITQAEKARTLAVYIKLMSINSYHQARQSIVFAAWPPPIQIFEETTRVQPLRSTRSGRSVPIYAGFDDDSSDFDLVNAKSKRRKISNSDNNGSDGVYSNKVVSLKRKSSKEESTRPVKEAKINDDATDLEPFIIGNNLKSKKNIFTIIED